MVNENSPFSVNLDVAFHKVKCETVIRSHKMQKTWGFKMLQACMTSDQTGMEDDVIMSGTLLIDTARDLEIAKDLIFDDDYFFPSGLGVYIACYPRLTCAPTMRLRRRIRNVIQHYTS